MSNVKPGDLAIIVGDVRLSGLIVEVLHAVPFGIIATPDGALFWNDKADWLVKPVGGPVSAYNLEGRLFPAAKYLGAQDKNLRPLPGIPDDITTETEATV